jgi:molybdopterin-synthase adenylyltransferase
MKPVLIVGVGGLGSPAALVLARSGVEHMTLIDDDAVDETNLHRQILFDDADVGSDKVERAKARLEREGASVHAIRGRLRPENAVAIFSEHALAIEGADNFATKFLAADAGAIARIPVVQAGAVRWSGWALASAPDHGACLRCVFEDIPRERVETCAEAGVIGPVVGAVGAIQAALALRILRGDASAAGELWSYRALEGRLRVTRASRRAGCPRCDGTIRTLEMERYAPAQCAY